MAERELIEDSGPPSLASRMWAALNKDGHLAAAARQGADELATALKAFPESVSIDEPGTIWNPTQGEIAANREADKLPTPSEIARDRTPYTPETGQDHGNERGRE